MGSYFPDPFKPKSQALQKRYDRLEMIASEKGVLERGLIPDGLKSAFAKTVDILMRPNYAVAGVFDVLSGTGQGQETMGGRVFRELFGEGDKETFGTVLKQAGYGEGGKLSDLIGANFLTNRWDPTARGTVGLALDVFLDPLTYMGFKGGRLFVHGKAGSFRINKAGQEFLEVRAKRGILKEGVRQGLLTTDDILPIMKGGKTAAGKSIDNILTETIRLKQATTQWKNLGRLGEMWVRRDFYKGASGTMARRMAQGGLPQFADPIALKFGTFPLIKADKLTGPVKALFGKLGAGLRKMPQGDDFVDMLAAMRDNADKVFNMVPWNARAKPAYAAFESVNFASRNQAEAVALEIVRDQVFGPEAFAKVIKSNDALWALARATDDPKKYTDLWLKQAEKAGLTKDQASKIMDDWRGLTDGTYAVERDAGLQILPKQPNYIPHMMADGLSSAQRSQLMGDEVMRQALPGSSKFTGESVGRFAERRSFQTFDDLFEAAAKRGFKDPEALVNKNGIDLMVRRVQAHYMALSDHQFIKDTLGIYAQGAVRDVNQRLRHTLQDTGEGLLDAARKSGKKIGPLDDQAIFDAVVSEADLAVRIARGEVLDPKRIKASVKAVGKFNKMEQAVFFQEMVPRIQNLAELSVFMAKHGSALKKIPKKYTNAVKRASEATNKVPLGTLPHGFKELSIAEGSYKGSWVVPEGVASGLERWKGSWSENVEVHGFLKMVDWATNWFKLAVTAPFPAFHVRNAYSNVFASAVDIRFAAFNPKMHRRVVQLLTSDKDFTIKSATGEFITSAELRSEMKNLGINIDQFLLAERTGKKNALTAGQQAGILKRWAQKSTTGVGRAIENEARALHYMALRERGLDAGSAMVRVNEFLFDYNRLSPVEKNVFRRIIPFYCVPDDSEALTRDGWKTVYELSVGDEILSYDIERDKLEWDSVSGIATFEHDQDLLVANRKSGQIRCTHEHRWPTRNQYGKYRHLKAAEDINDGDYLVKCAEFNDWPDESELTPREAALVGWVVTDGYSRVRGKHTEMMIYQSPQKDLDEIIALVGEDGTARKPHPESGVVPVSITGSLRARLAPYVNKDRFPELVTRLSKESAEAMWDAMFKAEGHHSETHSHFAQNHGPVLDGFQILSYQLGMVCNIGTRGSYIGKTWDAHAVKFREEPYKGIVWCPQTRNKTWVMRQNGIVMVTGNTWNSKNIRRQAKNLIERPGEALAPVKAFNQGPDSDALPEYLHGKLGIKLMNMPGKAGTHITGIDLPISNIDILWKGGLGKTFRSNLAMMNPLLKAPLEYALNMDSFTGRGIKGQQWMGQMGASMDKHLPQKLKDYFQLQKHENGGYTANGTRVYLATKAMVWSRFVSSGVRADEIWKNPKEAAGYWRLLTGVNFNEFEMDEAEAKELRNKIERLEQYLLDNGFAQEFRIVSPQKPAQKQGIFK